LNKVNDDDDGKSLLNIQFCCCSGTNVYTNM